VYTPNENFFGEDVIGYFALDPCGAMDFAEVIINVASVNDLPVAESDDFEATEDEALFGTVAENDYDEDDTELTFTFNTIPLLVQLNGMKMAPSFLPQIQINMAKKYFLIP
jgi:hypothetical protein